MARSKGILRPPQHSPTISHTYEIPIACSSYMVTLDGLDKFSCNPRRFMKVTATLNGQTQQRIPGSYRINKTGHTITITFIPARLRAALKEGDEVVVEIDPSQAEYRYHAYKTMMRAVKATYTIGAKLSISLVYRLRAEDEEEEQRKKVSIWREAKDRYKSFRTQIAQHCAVDVSRIESMKCGHTIISNAADVGALNSEQEIEVSIIEESEGEEEEEDEEEEDEDEEEEEEDGDDKGSDSQSE